jgi:predicted metal-dependent enzyme (double-stranded beta helix superfamily)
MFDLERFIAACRDAVAAPDGQRAVRELVAEAMAEPAAVAAALGDPQHAGLVTLYRASDLTVIDFSWAPWMCLKPHNHNMWSVVGILSGREDNVFWRRTEGSIEAAGARSLGAGDVAPLGTDIIHSVTNPIGKMTRAIHVYGGDFFAPIRPRSEWDHETLVERPWDLEATHRLFADAEDRAGRGGPRTDPSESRA